MPSYSHTTTSHSHIRAYTIAPVYHKSTTDWIITTIPAASAHTYHRLLSTHTERHEHMISRVRDQNVVYTYSMQIELLYTSLSESTEQKFRNCVVFGRVAP